MKKKNIEAVQQEMNTILSNRANEVGQLEDQITKDTEAIAAAEADMLKATDKGDLKAYQTAKASRDDSTDSKEMHQRRLSRLTEEPLISSAEYERMKSDIFEEMDKNTAEARGKLKALCDQIEEISDDLRETGAQANDVLKRVQRDLFGNRDRRQLQNGNYLGYPLEYKEHYDLLGWARRATEGEIYKQMKATEERRKMETAAPEEAAQGA